MFHSVNTKMLKEVSVEKLDKNFDVTKRALQKAKEAPENLSLDKARADFLDMVERYVSDAEHFRDNGDLLNAFAALNYAHGFLDAGARIGLWDVSDPELFASD